MAMHPNHIEEFDNGSYLDLMGYSGGAHKDGLFGNLELMYYNAETNTNEILHYKLVKREMLYGFGEGLV